MATYTKSTGQAGTMRIIVSYSQNVSSNQTTFSYRYELSNSWSATWTYGKSWNSSSAGSNHSGTFDIVGVQTITIRSGSVTKTHNSDGTLSNQTFSWTMGTTGTSGLGGPTTFSKSISVPTIPRATQPATPDLEAGEAGTISLPRASSSFTHQLRYSFGSLSSQTSGIGNSSTAGTSTSWTPPMSLLNQIPNATSGTGTMTATTKNGSTTIGKKSDSFKVTAPASVVPSFTGYSHSDSNTAVATEVDAYVQGLSVLNLSITGAAGAYGSTISTQGYTYQIGSLTSTVKTASGTMSQPIVDQDTVALTFTVTDSRGRTYSEGENVTVLPYVNPTLNSISVVRASDSGGTEAPDSGTYIRVNIDANVASLINSTQRNALTYKIETAPTGSSSWTTQGTWTPGGITFAGQRTVGPGFGIADSFQVRLTISDKFNSIQAIRTIPTAKVPFDVAEDGIGAGKVHQQGALDVGGDVYVSGKTYSKWGSLSITDCNLATEAGVYYCSNAANQAASTAHGHLVVFRDYNTSIRQEFRCIYTDASYDLEDVRKWVRTSPDNGATWSPWREQFAMIDTGWITPSDPDTVLVMIRGDKWNDNGTRIRRVGPLVTLDARVTRVNSSHGPADSAGGINDSAWGEITDPNWLPAETCWFPLIGNTGKGQGGLMIMSKHSKQFGVATYAPGSTFTPGMECMSYAQWLVG